MSTPPPAFPQPLVELIDAMFPVLVQFHETGSLAPHAAVCDAAGEISGSALVTDAPAAITLDEAIVQLELQQMDEALAGRITASGVFYHGAVSGDTIRPAEDDAEANAIVAHVETADASFTVVIPYERASSGAWEYLGPRVYLKERSVFIDLTAGGST